MARKNLLLDLEEEKLPAGNSAPEDAFPAEGGAPHLGIMGTRGAIGAVTRSIEQLKAQSVVEMQPALIEDSFIADRLETDLASHAELVASIRDHGQQVPILVRPHAEKSGRFQIAYGRRRLRAAAELGRPVRAIIKSLSDPELVVAQGQENSARTDLSFIEKAHFAAKLEEGGFDRETIMAALSVDKTGLSRLISAAVKVPRDILTAIGPAPKTGRDRWIELAARLEAHPQADRARKAIAADKFAEKSSDDRFNAVFGAAAPRREMPIKPTIWKDEQGVRVAQIREDDKSVTLAINKRTSAAFGRYLVDHLPSIYEAYQKQGS